MAAVAARCGRQQRHQLGVRTGPRGKGRLALRGAEEWWSHCRPLSTLALLGWGQSRSDVRSRGGSLREGPRLRACGHSRWQLSSSAVLAAGRAGPSGLALSFLPLPGDSGSHTMMRWGVTPHWADSRACHCQGSGRLGISFPAPPAGVSGTGFKSFSERGRSLPGASFGVCFGCSGPMC